MFTLEHWAPTPQLPFCLAGKRRRAGGLGPSAETLLEQREARALAEEQLKRQREADAASRAARSAALQRARATRRINRMLAEEEDVDGFWPFDGSTGDDEMGLGEGGAARGSSGGTRQPTRSHGERRLQFELQFRDHTQEGVEWGQMCAPQLAHGARELFESNLAVTQRAVTELSRQLATHPRCPAESAGSLAVISWRPVLWRCLYGTGVIHVPTFRCGAQQPCHAVPLLLVICGRVSASVRADLACAGCAVSCLYACFCCLVCCSMLSNAVPNTECLVDCLADWPVVALTLILAVCFDPWRISDASSAACLSSTLVRWVVTQARLWERMSGMTDGWSSMHQSWRCRQGWQHTVLHLSLMLWQIGQSSSRQILVRPCPPTPKSSRQLCAMHVYSSTWPAARRQAVLTYLRLCWGSALPVRAG